MILFSWLYYPNSKPFASPKNKNKTIKNIACGPVEANYLDIQSLSVSITTWMHGCCC
jgi:hypothetical protein